MSLATESIVRISIEWPAPTGTKVYGDKTATGVIGGLLDLSVVNSQINTESSGSISSANVVLNDTDGALKTIYDSHVIEGTVCTVTQILTGGYTESKILLKGKICGDIVWSEGERTLSFGIESTPKDSQVGYAPKEGDYAWLHPDAIGVVWPLCFGKVLRVPAVRALKPYELTLGEDVKYNDPSPFTVVNGDQLPQHPTSITIECGEVLFDGTMTDDQFTPTIWNKPKFVSLALGARPPGDEDEENPSVFWLAGTQNLMRHYCLCKFDGTNYTVNRVVHQEGSKCWCVKPWDGDLILTELHTLEEVARYPRTSWSDTLVFSDPVSDSTMLTIAKDGWKLLKDAVVYYRPVAGITDRYICNLYPSESVSEVLAHRTFFGKKILCAVPSSYYTLNLSETLGTRNVTSITMAQPLSSRHCEGWDDDLFVSLRSSLGKGYVFVNDGNTADILAWLLSTYTDLTVDSSAQAMTRLAVNDYPSNFALFTQPNAMELCRDIAWQARCGLVIQNGIAYIKYLPTFFANPTMYYIELTPSVVEMKTIELGAESTENVITKIIANWVREYSGEKIGVDGKNPEREYTQSNNTSTYGEKVIDKEFFIYNIHENVVASVDFWLKQKSNVWKTMRCRVFMDVGNTSLGNLTVFNNVVVEIPVLGYTTGNCSGTITALGYNTGEPIIELTAKLGIKVGEMTPSADFYTVLTGLNEDVLNGLATSDYTISSDNSCPDWVSIIPHPSPKYKFVFVHGPPPDNIRRPMRIIRGRPYRLFAEIQDDDGNLITSISPAFASLEVHTPDGRAVIAPAQKQDIIFTGGKWDNAGNLIQINGGDKRTVARLWIISKDKRILSSQLQIKG